MKMTKKLLTLLLCVVMVASVFVATVAAAGGEGNVILTVDGPTEVNIGDTVKVKVLEINEKGKVSLSIKKALPKEEKPKPQKPSKPRRDNKDRGWKGAPQQESSAPMSFEDMMAKFKAQSEDKMSDLKRSSDKRGGNTGYRRGPKQ